MELTPEQKAEHAAYVAKLADPRYYGEQDENGVDLSLIRANLRLTPQERLDRAWRARRSALRTMDIGKRNRAQRA